MPANSQNSTPATHGILAHDDSHFNTETMKSGPSVTYLFPNGDKAVLNGGTSAWRNNNPGNIMCDHKGDVKKHLGAIACDSMRRAIFPDYETGDRGMARMLRHWPRYRAASIEDAIKGYATKEVNPAGAYIRFVESKSGLSRDKRINGMTDEEFERFRSAMKQFERSTPGLIQKTKAVNGVERITVHRPLGIDPGRHYEPADVNFSAEPVTAPVMLPREERGKPDTGAQPSRAPSGHPQSRHSPSGDGAARPGEAETLRRSGDQVHRIEEDGRRRGYFISNSRC